MKVITTHINADFDGLASMIAAQKLYPDGIMTFPGAQERNVRDFISQNLPYTYQFEKITAAHIKDITSLIVVDTRSSKRLGILARCIQEKRCTIHIYDHHPQSEGDLHGDVEIIRNVGATTTILVDELQKQDIDISADEATIFCLGIYQDTGSLSHLTTTPEDMRMAAWLLEKGAKLDIVSQFLSNELTTLQVELLHELFKAAKKYTIQEIPVVVAPLSFDTFIDDFALIVKRFMDMENLDAIFALTIMAGRLQMIARSRIAEVNVGQIARDMGGGGHSMAASATIQNMTLIEAEEKLIRILHRYIRPQPVAREMMSQPAITTSLSTTIEQAHELLTRYNITVLPIVPGPDDSNIAEDSRLIAGMISRREVEKAIHHNLGSQPVSDYMTSDIEVLSLNATLWDIQELIIENRQRLVPIVHDGDIVGIITRTDLLNRLVNDPANFPKNLMQEHEYPAQIRTRNLTTLMKDSLDKPFIELLQVIGTVADELRYNAYAVGGFVRDLLFRKKNLDLDVVVEGEGIHFAQELVKTLGGRVVTHERFATATVVMPDGFKIDVATARLEYYESPASLPIIELSSIKLDLYRRDFTINAMAIQLNKDMFGTLHDFFNSQSDLKYRSIKVLHNLSFVEDPTRIFRAVRLEKRLDFTIAKHTERLLKNAVKMQLFGKGNDPRFFAEIKIILSEENPIPAVQRLAEFDLFQFLWPDLKPSIKIDRRFIHILTQAHRAISWYKLLYLKESLQPWKVYFLAIMSRSTITELRNFCKRFSLPVKIAKTLAREKEHSDKIHNLLQRRNILSNSEIYWLFEELNTECLLYLMAIARKSSLKQSISHYVTTLRQTKTEVNGKKLMALGYPPGPLFRKILSEVLTARLDNKLHSLEDELDFVSRNFPLDQNLP